MKTKNKKLIEAIEKIVEKKLNEEFLKEAKIDLPMEEKIILSNLLYEIKDRSLQKIIRQVIFSGKSVIEAVTQERPEMDNEEWQKLKQSR